MIIERRADLDWLRVIAFGLLIFFHAAVVFIPDGIPMIQNDTASPVLQVLVGFLHQFRLALLFLVSGVGVAFALKHRDRAAFMRERAVRLLVPLAFGILVVVPPAVFLEKRFIGAFDGTLAELYGALFTSGVYPEGHLSWHHYWFVAYLYLFCLLGWPLFAYARRDRGRQRLARGWAWLAHGRRLYLAVVPLALIEIALRAAFPGFRDLIHDWASFSVWLAVFICGFMLASHEPLLDRTQPLRRLSLALALTTTTILFAQFWSFEHTGFSPAYDGDVSVIEYIWFCTVRAANLWCWLLVCLGYAGRYLQRPSRVLTYLNACVYPYFCLHLTVIVALAYVIVPLTWPIAVKYLAITLATLALLALVHEGAIRRLRWLQPLLGMKPQPARGRVPASASASVRD